MPKLSPDSGLPLQPVDYHGIVLDVCPQTGGIWFDAGEIGKIKHVSIQALADLDRIVAEGRQTPSIDPSHRHCPCDAQLLYGFFYCEDHAIQLEECRTCGGVWCDHASLDAMAAHVLRENPDYVPPNLSVEAQNALAAMSMEHEQFMCRADAIKSFFQAADFRPGWSPNWLDRMGPDVDAGKPWL